jgi:hypothetical protein
MVLTLRMCAGQPSTTRIAATLLSAMGVVLVGLLLGGAQDFRWGEVNGAASLKSMLFHFGLFSGLGVVVVATAANRMRFFTLTLLALMAAGVQLQLQALPSQAGWLHWAADVAGLMAGPAAVEAMLALCRQMERVRRCKHLADNPDAAATDWFVALHQKNAPEFDWDGFERWLVQSRAHRAAYDRIEALWYEPDNAPLLLINIPKARQIGFWPGVGQVAGQMLTLAISPVEGDRHLALARSVVVLSCWGLAAGML